MTRDIQTADRTKNFLISLCFWAETYFMSIVHHARPDRPEFLTEHSGCIPDDCFLLAVIKLKETEGRL